MISLEIWIICGMTGKQLLHEPSGNVSSQSKRVNDAISRNLRRRRKEIRVSHNDIINKNRHDTTEISNYVKAIQQSVAPTRMRTDDANCKGDVACMQEQQVCRRDWPQHPVQWDGHDVQRGNDLTRTGVTNIVGERASSSLSVTKLIPKVLDAAHTTFNAAQKQDSQARG